MGWMGKKPRGTAYEAVRLAGIETNLFIVFWVVVSGFTFAKTGFPGFGIFIDRFGGCISGSGTDLSVCP